MVLEFKNKVTPHDVLIYSAKARRHKQVYPYLRYGFVASEELYVPRRFFMHNDALDFFAALKTKGRNELDRFFARLIQTEIKTSRRMESVTFGGTKPSIFRSEVLLDRFITDSTRR